MLFLFIKIRFDDILPLYPWLSYHQALKAKAEIERFSQADRSTRVFLQSTCTDVQDHIACI